MQEPRRPSPAGWLGLLALGVLIVLLAVWGAFLVPFRVAGVIVPVSWVVAVVGNVLIGRAAARLAGRPAAGITAVLWVLIVLQLGSRRSEGDLVIPQTPVGLGYLVLGSLACAVPFGMVTRAPAGPVGRRDAHQERS